MANPTDELEIGDAQPFPIREFRKFNGKRVPRSFIPMWIARVAYEQYKFHHGKEGNIAPLQYFFDQGGFEAGHLLDFIVGGNGDGKATKRVLRMNVHERSVKGEIDIIMPGTPQFAEFMREHNSMDKERLRQGGKLTFGSTGR